MRILALAVLVIVLARVPALAAQSPAPAPVQQSDATTLQPGDTVRIVVWRKPEFSGDFVVAPDGTITHPLYRVVHVAGLPLPTVEANIRRFLLNFDQDPQFVVEPLISVSVSGEVPHPTVFAVQPRTSLAEAVARAGGINQTGRRDKVRVFRREGSVRREVTFNLKDPTDPIAQGPVESGDQIVVDRNKNFVKDVLIPTLGLIGSLASIALLVRRYNR